MLLVITNTTWAIVDHKGSIVQLLQEIVQVQTPLGISLSLSMLCSLVVFLQHLQYRSAHDIAKHMLEKWKGDRVGEYLEVDLHSDGVVNRQANLFGHNFHACSTSNSQHQMNL